MFFKTETIEENTMSSPYSNGALLQNGDSDSVTVASSSDQDLSSANESPTDTLYKHSIIFPSGLDHAYASNRSDKATVECLTKEIQSLKQILTLHLNLIEQQSKKIESKDQALLLLQEELEFIKKKIKKENELESSECSYHAKQIDFGAQTELGTNDSKSVASVRKNRRHTVSSNENNAKLSKTLHRRTTSENDTRYSTSVSLQPPLAKRLRRNSNKNSNSSEQKDNLRSMMKSNKEYFSSPEYWTSTNHSHHIPVKSEQTKEPVCNSSQDDLVEVPSWRVVELSPLHDPEGIEDISDAVYEKRHRKYELEEKRQRRWEEKEFRNQQYKEKLKANRMQTARGREDKTREDIIADHVFSFFDPQKIEEIEIVNELPVIAFGSNMPNMARQEFQLTLDFEKITADHSTIKKEI